MLVLLWELPSRNRKVWEPSLGFCEKEVGKGGKYLPRRSFMSAPARRSYLRLYLLSTIFSESGFIPGFFIPRLAGLGEFPIPTNL